MYLVAHHLELLHRYVAIQVLVKDTKASLGILLGGKSRVQILDCDSRPARLDKCPVKHPSKRVAGLRVPKQL